MDYLFYFALVIIGAISAFGVIITNFKPKSSIGSVEDFYEQVDIFCRHLREHNSVRLAEEIEKAKQKGSMASEIIGDIGLSLNKIKEEVPTQLVGEAKDLQYFIRWHRRLLHLE